MGISRQSPPSAELKVFSERLREIIEFKKIEIAVLAKECGYKPDDVHRLLKGMREPGFKKLITLANSLGCSSDYLLGLTSKPQRADVVVEVDTNALKYQSSECGQTSGQISGKTERLAAVLPELPESDIDLLTHLAEFFIERKKTRLLKFVKTVIAEPKERAEETKTIKGSSNESKSGLDDCVPISKDSDSNNEDDLWDGIDDIEEYEVDDGWDEDFDDDAFGIDDDDLDDDIFGEDFDDD